MNRLTGHVVLCGFGQVGQAIFEELVNAGREVVVIDRNDLSLADSDVKFNVIGEATNDHSLHAAGLRRAGSLVIALDSDVDNLFITLTARAMSPGLFIVVRANESSVEPKLHQAGADQVVNPHRIGGCKMADAVLPPSSDDANSDQIDTAGLTRNRGIRALWRWRG